MVGKTRCIQRKGTDPWYLLFQEKMKGKNKLVPRLLGITKDSVMRVDEKTKEVLQEWPLTTVKRWAASPKSFTLVGTVRGPRGGQHGLGRYRGTGETIQSHWASLTLERSVERDRWQESMG